MWSCLVPSSLEFWIILTVVVSVGTLEWARYRIKFILYLLSCQLATVLTLPYMLARYPERDSKSIVPFAWILRQVTKLLGIDFQIRGKGNVVRDSGCVVIMNHQSILDVCVVAALWPVMQNCVVVVKAAIQYYGTFGLMCWLAGSVFIDRQNKEKAHSSLNTAVRALQDKQRQVMIFPEGHRHSNTTLLPFKKGAFHIAIEAQTPIQPVVISKYYFVNDKKLKFNSGTSYITILPAISTKGLTKDDMPKLMETAYELMNKTFYETSHEVIDEHVERLTSETFQ